MSGTHTSTLPSAPLQSGGPFTDVTATWNGTRGFKCNVHMSRKDPGWGKARWVTALSSPGHGLRGWQSLVTFWAKPQWWYLPNPNVFPQQLSLKIEVIGFWGSYHKYEPGVWAFGDKKEQTAELYKLQVILKYWQNANKAFGNCMGRRNFTCETSDWWPSKTVWFNLSKTQFLCGETPHHLSRLGWIKLLLYQLHLPLFSLGTLFKCATKLVKTLLNWYTHHTTISSE